MTPDLTQARQHFIKGDVLFIAKKHGVSTQTVHNIINGRSQNPKISDSILDLALMRKRQKEKEYSKKLQLSK